MVIFQTMQSGMRKKDLKWRHYNNQSLYVKNKTRIHVFLVDEH